MANPQRVARANRNMRIFDNMQKMILKGIDKHVKKKKEVEEAGVMSQHYVKTNEEGERLWSF